MLFIPQEKARKMRENVLKKSIERMEKRSIERRKEYLIAMEKGEL